jgi:hypothetical protein
MTEPYWQPVEVNMYTDYGAYYFIGVFGLIVGWCLSWVTRER